MITSLSIIHAQIDTNEIEIIGFIHTDQLYMLTNSEKRNPYHRLHERSVVIEKKIMDKYRELNDTIILNLLKNSEAFMYYGDCYNILHDIFHIVKENDTLLNVVRKSHPVRYVEEKDGRFFGVIEDFIDYISHHPIVIDKKYYYQVFNTECFLLVSAPYRICFNRQPLLSFGDGIYRDFWLDPDSPQKVVVVIPLICDNN